MNYTACLFDFDYTLADSSVGIVKCFRIVLERHGFCGVPEDSIRRTIGKTLEESCAHLNGETRMEVVTTGRKEYTPAADMYMNANTRLYPDALPTLRWLKSRGIRVGILSTKYRRRIVDFFRDKDVPGLIDLIIGGEDVAQAKPHPEGLFKAMQCLNVEPSDVLYVGDSVVDARTAENAGVDFAGVLTGTTLRSELAVYPHVFLMSSLSELMQS